MAQGRYLFQFEVSNSVKLLSNSVKVLSNSVKLLPYATMSAVANLKCVVIGDGNVGKTCFIIAAKIIAFPADYRYFLTMSDSYDGNPLQLRDRDGRQAAVSFWDTGNYIVVIVVSS